MAKVVFLIPPSHNHMNPTLGLAKELAERGEEVIYFSSEPLRRKIESLGAQFRCYPPINWYGTNGNMNMDSYGLEGLMIQAAGFLYGNKKIAEFMIELVTAESPDYLIHDSYCLWAKQVAKKLGIPAIASVATPVFNSKLKDIDPAGFVKLVLRSADPLLPDKIIDIIADLEIKFKKTYEIEDFCDIFIARETLNIVYTSEYFQTYRDSFDDTYKFVGASIFPRTESLDFPYDKLTGEPLVYIAMGGVVDQHADLYQKCIEALREKPVQVVLSLNKVPENSLQRMPDNFIACKYVPQLEILHKTALFISHGGINSVSEALYYDVPIVLAPFFGDQCWIAKRVESLGAGIYLDPNTITADQIKDAATQILDNPSFRQNSKRIGDSLRMAGGYRRAADEVFIYKKQHSL